MAGRAESTSPVRSSKAGRSTLLLFLLFQALYALTSSGNVFRVPDEFEVYFQTEHLVDAGDLSVPQTLAIRQPVIVEGKVVGSQSMFFGEVGLDGKPYAPYGPLVGALAVPHHLVGRLVARIAGVPRAPLPNGIAWLVVVGGITMLATATAAALTVAGFHRAALALGTPDREALVLSLLLGGTTVLWSYGTSFFSEAWQAAALIWAVAFLLSARQRARRANAAAEVFPVAGALPGTSVTALVIAAGLVAGAGLTKLTSLVFAPAFVVAILRDEATDRGDRLKAAITVALGIAVAVGIHLGWNVYRFGRPFDLGYDWAETIPHLPARAFLLNDIPRGLTVLLLSPGKSIVQWAPAILLAAWRAPSFARREPAVATGIGVAAATGLLFFAAYLFPEGGYSHGPRNLVPIVPLMLLPAAGPGAGGWRKPVLGVIAAAGMTVALLSTCVSFLEDQTLGGDLTGGARTVYYERIDPQPGRVWNQYRLGYIPFVQTLLTPGWLHAASLGLGPDYFPLHLMQARRQVPNGATIPLWLVWGLPVCWLALLTASAYGLMRSA